MKRLIGIGLVALMAVAGPAAAAPDNDSAAGPEDRLRAYEAELTPGEVQALRAEGVDVEAGADDAVAEIIATGEQADELRRDGVALEEKTAGAAADAFAAQEDPVPVFRPWSGPGNLEEELRAYAAAHPDLVKVIVLGESVQGQEILAFKVTRDANEVADGSRPASIYLSTQHAREWIVPEMNRRLLRYMVDGYGTDTELTNLLDRNEFWFIPVANPDGYDYTFTEGNRLWRKNLRDNNGDGAITSGDGVDLNRNFPYRWGYDNEGSSPNPASQTYRGPGPASEPETQALIGLFERHDFSFLVNYHSAAELLLYGVGWQVSTPSPDDLITAALAGTDTNQAVPGYDPDLSAELYTTNGDTDTHAQEVNDILGFTPEMSTCQYVSDLYDDDVWEADDCQSGFNFPDDERLVQEEFEKNIPFALSIARSTDDPDDPESAVGIDPPDFVVDDFSVSYGSPQTVQATVKRALGPVVAEYRINGGRRRIAVTREWDGGERYGGELDTYYAPRRAEIRGAKAGDTVAVTFRAVRGRSETFSYVVESDSDARVLVLANEDYDGFNPEQDADAPKYLDRYTAALEANGVSYDVWDQDAQGAPDPLGVLSHYEAIVWYTGDNRITQDEQDREVLGIPDLGVSEVQQFTTLAVRDFLNEGGKLFHTGENAGYFGAFDILYWGDDDDPSQQCGPESEDCLLLSDDFYQYYLGAYARTQLGIAPETVTGVAAPFEGAIIELANEGTNVQDEAGQFVVTSDVLPPEEFPQFASQEAADYVDERPDPTQPLSGEWYAGALHGDESYTSLSRTIDLTGATSAELSTGLSYNTEGGYDFVIVEARTVGQENWTTLPDAEGRAVNTPTAECEAGFLLALHPSLSRYLTNGPDGCTTTGTSGEFHMFTGNSGWGTATFDLSAFAGSEVEVLISYVTDPATGGTGVFVDDTAVTIDGVTTPDGGFETDLAPWTVVGAPEGSPATTATWERSQSLVEPVDLASAVTTEDTVYTGFGFEAIETEAQRADVMRRVLDHLLP